ncbi:MAG: PAC2 family protein [Candidatus Omnitrophica bacterium]|nr:PAC2 family protein [Candidatus Omnitrophota bacterium]MDD5574114.1 PAC2 family protein [Candidatus Omnitrophota bacterium]
MKSITIKKRIRLKNPVLIAAWPGMGDVALKAAMYLKDKLGAQEFASLESCEYFHPSGVWIENNLIDVPQHPVGHFYFFRNPGGASDLIIFISDAQPFIEKGYEYAAEIVDFIISMKVRTVYTFAAMPLPIEHTQVPEVYAVSTKKEILEQFEKANVKSMPSGQISGLNGLILGVAKEKGLDGVCLLGEIPLYTIQIENPMASKMVLEVLARYLNLSLDLDELQKHADQINQEIEHLIEYLKNPPEEEKPIDQKEIDIIKRGLAESADLPDSARGRIDELFRQAKKDLSRAIELKKELDKWNVYEKYEDSFLDLFKKPPKKNN